MKIATYTIIVPLGFADDPLEAAEIAQRIADMDIYDGDPIDPNDMRFGLIKFDSERGTKCDSIRNTDEAICKSNMIGDLQKCAALTAGGAAGGCAVGVKVCGWLPPPGPALAICCGLGGIAGGVATLSTCVSIAQADFDTCGTSDHCLLHPFLIRIA